MKHMESTHKPEDIVVSVDLSVKNDNCDLCDKAFSTKSELNRHINKVHLLSLIHI